MILRLKMLNRLFNAHQAKLLKQLVCVAPDNLCFRIVTSLVPPVTAKYKKISVDLLGPAFAVAILIIILNYGSTLRYTKSQTTPVESVLLYIIFMPVVCFILNVIGQSWLTFLEVFSLIGYALYGHIVALLVSLFIYLETSDVFFYVCLAIFGGLSTLRLVLLQLQSIPLPGARLLVCSIVSVVHILFLVFLHFTYMHPNFVYGINSHNSGLG